ncbi:MAG TPA: SDR family oxidoreductase [Burkholderiaceae bacterium]|jgi:glucose 1-dehydrogenase
MDHAAEPIAEPAASTAIAHEPAATVPARISLAGQVALVTGASSGIGRAMALAFGRSGADLVVNFANDAQAADQVVAELHATGRRALAVRADVSREAEVERMFEQAVGAFGTLHVVVCNAGLQRDAPFEQMTIEQWNTVIGVNLTGQFLCARAAVREFKRRGVDRHSVALGKIICMSSVHERIPWAGHANYAASKGGVMLLMQTMAQELAAQRIRVNGIAPGAIRTPINAAAWQTPKGREALMSLIPYGRIGEPDDVAQAAVWLASDAADYVTGTTLFVDGGMALYPAFVGNG